MFLLSELYSSELTVPDEVFSAGIGPDTVSHSVAVEWQTRAGFVYEYESSFDLQSWTSEGNIYGFGQPVSLAVAPLPENDPQQGGGDPAEPVPDRLVALSMGIRLFPNGKILVSWSGSNGPVSVLADPGWNAMDSAPLFYNRYPVEETSDDANNPGQTITENVLYSISVHVNNQQWNPELPFQHPVFDGTSFSPASLSPEDESTFLDFWFLVEETTFHEDLFALADGDAGAENEGAQHAGIQNSVGAAAHFRVKEIEVDSDGDGLADHLELAIYGGSPFLADTDSDGLSDRVEMLLGLNPNDPDTDGDGTNDSEDQSLDDEPQWQIVIRGAEYDFTKSVPVDPQDDVTEYGYLDLTNLWEFPYPTTTLSLNSLLTFPEAESALNTEYPFPTVPEPEIQKFPLPTPLGAVAISQIGVSESIDTVTESYLGSITQSGGWLVIPKPRNTDVTFSFLDVRTTVINQEEPTTEMSVLEVTIPAGQTHSAFVPVIQPVQTPPKVTGTTQRISVTRQVQYVDFTVDANRDGKIDVHDEMITFRSQDHRQDAYFIDEVPAYDAESGGV